MIVLKKRCTRVLETRSAQQLWTTKQITADAFPSSFVSHCCTERQFEDHRWTRLLLIFILWGMGRALIIWWAINTTYRAFDCLSWPMDSARFGLGGKMRRCRIMVGFLCLRISNKFMNYLIRNEREWNSVKWDKLLYISSNSKRKPSVFHSQTSPSHVSTHQT